MLPDYRKDKWLNTAVSGIKFGPDRRAVREELAAHMEDREADLRRIFPDIPEEEARDRALSAMGDAEEVKKELAQVHKPWLGWLWTASRWLVRGTLAVLLAVCVLGNDHYASAGFPLWMDWTAHYPAPADLAPERAELRGYTFRITQAAYLEDQEALYLALRVSSPRFWERIDPEGLYACLTAVSPDGTRWPVSGAWTEPCARAHLARWDLFSREFGVYIPTEDWRPGEPAGLEIGSPAGSIALSAVAERTVGS